MACSLEDIISVLSATFMMMLTMVNFTVRSVESAGRAGSWYTWSWGLGLEVHMELGSGARGTHGAGVWG